MLCYNATSEDIDGDTIREDTAIAAAQVKTSSTLPRDSKASRSTVADHGGRITQKRAD